MATAYSAELASAFSTGSAVAGLGGSPVQTRGSKRPQFTFTIPASGAGSTAADIIIIGMFDVTAQLFAVHVSNDAMGASTTFSIGRIDTNNSANTDAVRYSDAVDTSVAGSWAATKNLPSQMGTDPIGDQSTGQAAPNFGNGLVFLTMTIGGTPTAGTIISGYMEFADRAGVS